MITLTALFLASWIAIVILESQGFSVDVLSKLRQAIAWDSPELQPIAIPVKTDQRSAEQ